MHNLMSQSKSGFILGVCVLATIYIGWHLFLPIMIIYIPLTASHEGVPLPAWGRKGYVRPEYDVSFSENGRFVAFTTNGNSLRHYYERSNKGLFLYDAQLGKTQQVSTGLWNPAISIERPQISKDGSHILFFAATVSNNPTILEPPVRLYVYNVKAQETKEIVVPEDVRLSIRSQFKLSPDGRYLGTVISTDAMFIYDQKTDTYTVFSGEQLYASGYEYEIQNFSFLPNQEILFSAKSGPNDLYGIYSLESGTYGVIDQPTYDRLNHRREEPRPEDVASFARKERNRFYGLTPDGNTAVLLLGENHTELGDYNLTYDLYKLDRSTGELSRIPTPNWKRSAFLILTVMNTILAGYILLTDPAQIRPFPIHAPS